MAAGVGRRERTGEAGVIPGLSFCAPAAVLHDRLLSPRSCLDNTSAKCFADCQPIFKADHALHAANTVRWRTFGTEDQFRNLQVTDLAGKDLSEGLPGCRPGTWTGFSIVEVGPPLFLP